MTEKNGERKEVYVDFEGKGGAKREKPLVPEDAYSGTIKSVQCFDAKKWQSQETEKKLVFSIGLNQDSGEEVEVPYYVRPLITKGNKEAGYSSSNLYLLLEASGLLEDAQANQDSLETIDQLNVFLVNGFVGKKVRVMVKTARKNTEQAYSVVDKIVRFEGD